MQHRENLYVDSELALKDRESSKLSFSVEKVEESLRIEKVDILGREINVRAVARTSLNYKPEISHFFSGRYLGVISKNGSAGKIMTL